MYKHIFSLIKKIIGVALILAGIISGFIPIVQGWILIVAGLLILGVKKETIKKWVRKSKKFISKKKP